MKTIHVSLVNAALPKYLSACTVDANNPFDLGMTVHVVDIARS